MMSCLVMILVSLVVELVAIRSIVEHYSKEVAAAAVDFLTQYWKNFHWNYSELQLRLPAIKQ